MDFRQLQLTEENSKNLCKPIAGLKFLPGPFMDRFGVSFSDLVLDSGMGPVRAALVETGSKRRFGLIHFELHPEPKGIAVWTHEHTSDSVADLKDFIESFELSLADFTGIEEAISDLTSYTSAVPKPLPGKGAEPRDILVDLDNEGYDGGGQSMV